MGVVGPGGLPGVGLGDSESPCVSNSLAGWQYSVAPRHRGNTEILKEILDIFIYFSRLFPKVSTCCARKEEKNYASY